MDGAGRSPGGITLGAFALAVTLGGANFLAVRYSNLDLAPFWGAGLRFAAAGVLFVAIALVARLSWPRGVQLVRCAAYGVLGITAFYALMYWSLLRVTAGVATIVLATVPLVTLLLAAAHRLERLGARTAIGAVLALAGIVWMVIGPQSVDLPVGALIAMVAAALCIGESIILGKQLVGVHPAVTNAVGMIVGAPLLLVLSLLAGEPWELPTRFESVWALIYLVTLGSGLLFVLVLFVVGRWTASATSYMFVLFPVVTLVLGAILAGEPVTLQAVTGAVVVMAGVWFGALSPAVRKTPAPQPLAAAERPA